MDICTLSVMAYITLQGCISNYEKVCYERDNIRYCQSDYGKLINNSCNSLPKQYWDCARPDGTSYTKEYINKPD